MPSTKPEDVVEVECAEGLGAEAVADGAGGEGGGPFDEGAGVEGFFRVGREGGFGSPDLNAGIDQAGGVGEARLGGEFDGGGGAAEQAASR